MPRQQRTPVDKGDGAEIFDAFARTKGSVPDTVTVEDETVRKPVEAPVKTKPKRPAKAKAVVEPPKIRRMGRRRTGRSVQFNQSVTAETANNYYDMQAKLDIPMGAVLELAIGALIEKIGKEGQGD